MIFAFMETPKWGKEQASNHKPAPPLDTVVSIRNKKAMKLNGDESFSSTSETSASSYEERTVHFAKGITVYGGGVDRDAGGYAALTKEDRKRMWLSRDELSAAKASARKLCKRILLDDKHRQALDNMHASLMRRTPYSVVDIDDMCCSSSSSSIRGEEEHDDDDDDDACQRADVDILISYDKARGMERNCMRQMGLVDPILRHWNCVLRSQSLSKELPSAEEREQMIARNCYTASSVSLARALGEADAKAAGKVEFYEL